MSSQPRRPTMQLVRARRHGRRPKIEQLEPRTMLAAVTQQIIVDQFGWRASDTDKTVIFADPITGQNSANTYVPGTTFQLRRVSDNAVVFTGNVVAWNGGATQTQSGDKVWWGNFSSYTTPGTYYIYDPTNNLQSYSFQISNSVYSPVLTAAERMYLYQREGINITAANGGNWNHPASYVGTNQDLTALEWLSGAAVPGTARNVSGGWADAGDMNKYVPFTTSVIWDLLQAVQWNPAAFSDSTNIPESGNGVPDMLDEVKYELDWILRMQTSNGSVCNRVGELNYVNSSPPNSDTSARYYSQPTSWATASAAASFAHAAQIFANYSTQYPGYATTLLNAAQNAWTWLNANPSITPSNFRDAQGNYLDGAGSGGGGSNFAAAEGNSTADADKRLRVLAAAELFSATGNTTYRTYFDTWVKDPSTYSSGHSPFVDNKFDTTITPELTMACMTYAMTPNATPTLVSQIKGLLNNSLNEYLGYFNSGTDAYRAYMYDGHYCWGSNQIKARWGDFFIYGIELGVNPSNNAAYLDAAEEYLHYFGGRNPLSMVYLSNMGPKGANLITGQSSMNFYHGWFIGPNYDGTNTLYGPAPGYLVGGPNQFYDGSVTPPKGQPPQKAYVDWSTGYPDNSWEVTEPGIYYQSSYILLLSQFATTTIPQTLAPTFSPAPAAYNAPVTVTISDTTSGASIRYTLDGTTPTETNGVLYTGPFAISATATLQAIAYKSGMSDSSVTSGSYTIGVPAPAPTFSPAPAAYQGPATVAISDTTTGTSIRYTLDGTTPTETNGVLYTGPITISTTATLQAIAYKSGMADSTITSGMYSIGSAPLTYIYQDAVAPDWNDWSWSSTNNFANTSPVKDGADSISATFYAAWAGLSLDKGTAVNTAGFTGIQFWVNGGSATKPLKFYSQTADNSGNSPNVTFAATANTWTLVTIPLSSLGNPATIKRINFADTSGTAQSATYFDDICLYSSAIDNIPPTISATTVNSGVVQRSMVTKLSVTFSEAVTLSTGVFTLLNRGGSVVPNVTLSYVNTSGDQMTWDITFTVNSVANSSLPDGAYRLLITAADVHDLAGNAVASDDRMHFWRLFGDANGDRQVDRTDLAAFRQALANGTYISYFDFDGSGTLTLADYNQFRKRLIKPLI